MNATATSATTDTGRRERKKRETRQALEDAAWRLFTRKGYDATTITDITDAVDVAPRTFFRYFDSKEAVLFGDWRTGVEEISQRVAARPSSESTLEALAHVLVAFSERFEVERAIAFQRARIAATSSHVGHYHRQVIQPVWEDTLTAAVADRLAVDAATDLRPGLFAGVAIAVLLAALTFWIASNGDAGALPALVRQGFSELAEVR